MLKRTFSILPHPYNKRRFRNALSQIGSQFTSDRITSWHVIERLRQARFIGAFIPKFISNKRTIMHASFLGLMGVVTWQNGAAQGVDRSSLLYSLVSGEEMVQGPLDPSVYAQTDSNAANRIAAIDTSSVDFIGEGDPEVQYSNTLGGTAMVALLQPEVPQPGSEGDSSTNTPRASSQKSFIYTVEDGDTIAGIAANFNISTNTVLWANGLTAKDTLRAGDHLIILPTTGVLHTVQGGDTVSEVANKYDVKSSDIVAYNNIEGDKLSIGQKLIVPDGNIAPQQAPLILPNNTRVADGDNAEPTPSPIKSAGSGWLWPTISHHMSQYFGQHGHTGIDIDNRSRPAVFAAQGGTIEFAGWLGGYGNLIIINHGSGVTSYYAHLEKLYVGKGQKVTKGGAVGKMGSTGRSTGPHLHFEVRYDGRPINPLGVFKG